uniref:tRNA (N6-threonylcarbamoyladenosine(37)-N6)-methyltransferase TrmO n=1 Tax=Eubacterium cellulosolvens TaxID=29322 RepID=UPI00055023EA|nr:tRNA (N6-threonylcarbamoyladenosine(37)-N6)-methyltransferase TrmO [[Eubacterium] cellulosolvens]
MELKPIAYIHSPFPEKFGIPRQSGLADTSAEIVLESEYASAEAVRGLEDYNYLWLIWQFSANAGKAWHPTVRPPRLGGNTRIGVFATRSPFRPNPLGLSSVRLDSVSCENGKITLRVSGADLMDGTPIYDIKPYIPYADCHEDAVGGFTDRTERLVLRVEIPAAVRRSIPASVPTHLIDELTQVLAQDPRPSYQHDPERVYGLSFDGLSVHFTVDDDRLTVQSIKIETK